MMGPHTQWNGNIVKPRKLAYACNGHEGSYTVHGSTVAQQGSECKGHFIDGIAVE